MLDFVCKDINLLYFCSRKIARMTYEQTLDYLYNQFPVYHRIGARAFKVGLGNSDAIADHLGHPHRSYRTIHVAGTNGKGSTSHTLASILQSAGYVTGLYTSPHLVDFRERIRVDGCMIPKEEVVNFVKQNEQFFRTLSPSFFEITMAMAFEYFRRTSVDVAVVETGLGGRLDSTNIITPDLSIITNIGFDHMTFLGETLPEIAFEKAGIIKSGIPAVIGERHAETDDTFINKANEVGAPLTFAEDRYKVTSVNIAEDDLLDVKLRNAACDEVDVTFSLTGYCQEKNIVTILAAVDELRRIGYDISDDALREGLENVQEYTGLMGRWQKVAERPDMIVDTGHNAHGIKYVARQIEESKYENIHIVWGMVSDKHPETVLPLLPKKARYYFTKAQIERAIPPNELAEMGKKAGLQGDAYENVTEALLAAKKNARHKDLIFIGGSNFIVAEVL